MWEVCAVVSVPVKQTQITWRGQRDVPAQAQGLRQPLSLATAPIHHYRDGDVVVYRRPGSAVWQCRCANTPVWLSTAETAGKSRDDFLIK